MDGRKQHKRGRMMRGEGRSLILILFRRIVFWSKDVENEKGVFLQLGHTTSGWTWARRAREPVEVPWARNYFLV